MSGQEQQFLAEAFDTNWVAPVGPHIDRFEAEFAERIGLKHAVAVSSGTAAMHLTIRHLDLQPGEEVFCSSGTFAATVNPVVYERGSPVFIDSDPATWNIDCNLLQDELKRCAKRGKLPRAVIAVDLYGQCADWVALTEICDFYAVPLIEDAAEALGATYAGKPAGSFGWANIFSFNGNKIITTSGGGMLVTNDAGARQPGSLPGDASPRSGSALRTFADRLQLSPQQSVGGRGTGPAPRARRTCHRADGHLRTVPGGPGKRAGDFVHAGSRLRLAPPAG